MFFLEEPDLKGCIKDVFNEPDLDEEKEKIKKDMIKSKRIMVDPIKDHLISQVSSKNTPKEMFDALISLFEGKTINGRMTLRNQLKGVNIQKT